jgi:uncharacterized protein YmfQ (DUF2313 family)
MLLKKMPGFYENSGMMMNLFLVEDKEIQNLRDALESTLNQYFIESADTTIDRWEKEVGLPKSNLPLEQRRSTIMSKLRGYGTVTVSKLRNVCAAYGNGDAQIIEKPSTYEFEIKFDSIMGIPPNMDDLKKVIEQIKPAHLGVTYVYTFLTMGELSSYDFSMSQMTLMNMTMAEWSVYRE